MVLIDEARQLLKQQLIGSPGISGVGSGSHIPGEPEHLWIYVKDETVDVPSEVNGIPVLKKVTGDIRALSIQVLDTRLRHRPYLGGVSIGAEVTFGGKTFSLTGTLGMVVRNAKGEKLMLTNNHVSAYDTLERSSVSQVRQITQPGKLDGGDSSDVIATLERWIPISESLVNLVDCAFLKPVNQDDALEEILGLGSPTDIGAAATQMEVQKVGRSTGLTRSRIIDVNAAITVNYGPFSATFDDQIVIDNGGNNSFGAAGDSGSVILNGLTPVGLLFGGSSTIIVANKIQNVFKAFRGEPAAIYSPVRPVFPIGALLIAAGVGIGIYAALKKR